MNDPYEHFQRRDGGRSWLGGWERKYRQFPGTVSLPQETEKWNGDQRGCESKEGLMVASVLSGITPVDRVDVLGERRVNKITG